MTFPFEVSVYFGVTGSLGATLFILFTWEFVKAGTRGGLQADATRGVQTLRYAGFACMFAAQWSACGIGGPPGNLLSDDPAIHNPLAGLMGAMAGIAFSVMGWTLFCISERPPPRRHPDTTDQTASG